jgi:hypothetical protein
MTEASCFMSGGTLAAAALLMLSARPCPSSLCVFIQLHPAFALKLAILCALLGLWLAVLGCRRGGGGRAERGAEYTWVSVSSPVPSPMPSPSPTPLLLWPFLCYAERAVPLSGQSCGRRNPLLPHRWHHRHRRHHRRRIWGAKMQIRGVL